MSIARVELDIPLSGPFDYTVGDLDVTVGSLVVVPFGRRRLVGVVTCTGEHSALAPSRLKAVERVLPVAPLPPYSLSLAAFAADYYRYPLGRVLAAALPTMLRKPRFGQRTNAWHYTLTRSGEKELGAAIPLRATGQKRLLQALGDQEAIDSVQAQLVFSGARKVLDRWVEAGWVEKYPARRRQHKVARAPQSEPSRAPVLTGEQAKAVSDIRSSFGKFAAWLLHGVTGSGKTEVYLALIDDVAASGRQTLLLVPEINLTPQLESHLSNRFPALELVSLHSGLAEGERLARWERARSGEASIVLGTRLAIFTPLPRLGLVIVDEEHDSSFKQSEGLRYHARDLAVYVASTAGVPVVLGSATPSLETYSNVLEGRYRVAALSMRATADVPFVRFIDVREHPLREGLSEPALAALEQRFQRREQSLVYINRRGYAPVLLCDACGWMAQCGRCSARLTLHARSSVLRCHYCGHEERIAQSCPHCGNLDLRGLGQGTQRVEDVLKRSMPDARILRIDSDSTRRRGTFAAMREQVRDEQVDILVGTQMLAKGHDFPKLTLVVIVGADNALYSSDFRASERLYQQLMQVAGRAGRGELAGEVLLQTQFPQHPLFQAFARQDYAGYASELLQERRRSGFPPYVYQAVLRAEAHREDEMWSFLNKAAQEAAELPCNDVTIYDAVPAPVFRVAGRYRGQLLIQATSRTALRRFLASWVPQPGDARPGPVRWVIDVDPVEL